jgi:hypothetical protein
MAIALPDIAPDTIAPAYSSEKVRLTGRGAHTFTRPALDLFEHTARTDRRLAAPEGAAELMMNIYDPACEDCFDGAKPLELTTEHRDGLHTWASWLHNSDHSWNELKQVKREMRYEHIARMARRELYAQRVHQVFSYLDTAADFSGKGYEDYAMLPDLVSETDLQKWGFADYDSLTQFAIDFKDLTSTIHYKYVYANELRSAIGASCEPEMQAKLSLFSFFYFNRLYPPMVEDEMGREARRVGLRRLGLPEDTQYIDLADKDNHEFLKTFDIGRAFSNWNASYLRTDEQRSQIYKQKALAA